MGGGGVGVVPVKCANGNVYLCFIKNHFTSRHATSIHMCICARIDQLITFVKFIPKGNGPSEWENSAFDRSAQEAAMHIGDPPGVSGANLPEMEPVTLTWEIIEGATERGGAHLVNSTGYQYVRRRAPQKNGTTHWICSKKTMGCRATVTQRNDAFTQGTKDHTCLPCPGLACAAKVRATVNQAAMTQPLTSARDKGDKVLVLRS